MEASMYFPIPEICVASFVENSYQSDTHPIMFLCRQSEQCDFINSQIIAGNTVIGHLNIDDLGAFGLFLEVQNPSGFIITREDCELIQSISMDDKMPALPTSCLLTRIFMGAEFMLDPMLTKTVLGDRMKAGFFNVCFGFRMNGNGMVYSSEEPLFIHFEDYSSIPGEQFAEQLLSDNNQVGL